MLTRYTLKKINQGADITLPGDALFDLPEKVLQFGTGALLRGLPDYFIDKANRKGIFNGRIVVIKSTERGDLSAFDKQDCLYTLCIRGIEDGRKVEQNIINSSVSRVLSAKTEWGKILQCAHNPDMSVVVSNTTEVGITFVKDDIWQSPPVSFPGKLLSFLYERYKAFDGSEGSGMVIVPTELIPDNGKRLESIVLELAHLNGLEESFMDWLENSNYFCNSLVDRMVRGKPAAEQEAAIEKKLGYQDDLLILADPYRLWAIETPSEKVKTILSFSAVDEGVAISADITRFHELKLRLLNGTHTLACGLAVLSGYITVKERMEEPEIRAYMNKVMTADIIPAIVGSHISKEDAEEFAGKVLDRFRNPYIDHQWLSIAMQYSSKMKMRNLPIILACYERYKNVPEHIALGFAAYLLFMRCQQTQSGAFIGKANGFEYIIEDDKASVVADYWKKYPVPELVKKVMQDESLWETDLTELTGFAESVTIKLQALIEDGPKRSIKKMLAVKNVVQT